MKSLLVLKIIFVFGALILAVLAGFRFIFGVDVTLSLWGLLICIIAFAGGALVEDDQQTNEAEKNPAIKKAKINQ